MRARLDQALVKNGGVTLTERGVTLFNRVGSLTRLMVKTYNDKRAAKGSGRCIVFTDFGDDATNNMMLIHEPPVQSGQGSA